MADTPAERQRRSRAHKRGDHSLCDPARCRGDVTVTAAVTRDVTTQAGPARPARLGSRGRRLWDQLTAGATLPPVELLLVEEACRIADRLERLDAVLAGESDRWMEFRQDEETGIVVVYIDKALSEARQQAVALKQLVGELRQMRGAATAGQPRPAQPAAPAAGAAAGGKGANGVADLTARIADKRRGAAAG